MTLRHSTNASRRERQGVQRSPTSQRLRGEEAHDPESSSWRIARC